ncbi:MAG TPA: pyridoxamine 5'-phosphate oxidase family protein [Blastocatellia bacterium]|nr:pyridoxamine 5'-phosphate oxidase family protein [Blastocatellia bacterium]
MQEFTATLKEFIEKAELLRLAYLDSNGYPRLVPLWFVVKDGQYYFGTDAASAKAKALKRDPRAGWVIDGGEEYKYKGASMCGRAETVTDPGLRAEIYRELGMKYFGSTDHPKFKEIYGEADDARTAYVRLKPEDGTSWEY